MGQPNLYMPVSAETLERKIDLLNSHFGVSAFQAVVRFGNLSRIGPAERHGMSCAGTLRGSILCAQAYSGLICSIYLIVCLWRSG